MSVRIFNLSVLRTIACICFAILGMTFTVAAEASKVTIPSFKMNSGSINLSARQEIRNGREYIKLTLRNAGAKKAYATISWRSPDWWQQRKNPYLIEKRNFQLKPGERTTHVFSIPYTKWNPYNRYPVTCILESGGQKAEKTIEICGKASKGVRLGEPRSSEEIKESKFGINYNYGRPIDYDVLSQSGAKWIRTWAYIQYADGEKVTIDGSKGFYDELNLSKEIILRPDFKVYLEKLQKYKINSLMLLPLVQFGGADKKENIEKYRLYCKRVAELMTKYGQRWFELGNEPSGKWGNVFGGDWNAKDATWVPYLCAMVRAGAKGIKEGNPQALVSTGGGVLPASYRMLDEGLGPDMDAVTTHPYSYSMLPEVIPYGDIEHLQKRDGIVVADKNCSYTSAMRMLVDKAKKTGHPKMKVWNTENGFASHQHIGRGKTKPVKTKSLSALDQAQVEGPFMYEGYTERTQAKYVARRMVESAAVPEMTMFIYFDFIDDFINPYHPEANFGLTKYGGVYPKPSYYAFQRIASLFSDGVVPLPEDEIKVTIPLDLHTGRVGLFWDRPYTARPVRWENKVPMLEPRYPRCYVFKGSQGELMLAIWAPVYAQDERKADFCHIAVKATGYEHPIEIDSLTGDRRDLEMLIDSKGNTILKNVRFPDYPVIVKLFPKK